MSIPELHDACDAGALERWLALQRWDYSRVGEHWAVLRLLAGLGADLGAPAEAKLVVQRGPETSSYPARACALERRLLAGKGGAASELLWRASFAVPLEVVEFGTALFALAAPGRVPLALSPPDLRILRPQSLILSSPCSRGARDSRIHVGQFRHRFAALATAVAVTATSSPAIGLAATGALHSAPVAAAPTGQGAGHPTMVVHLPAPRRAHPSPGARTGPGRPRSPLPAAAPPPVTQVRAAQPAVKELFSHPAQPAKLPLCKPTPPSPATTKHSKLPLAHEAAALKPADCVQPSKPAARRTKPAQRKTGTRPSAPAAALPGTAPGTQHTGAGVGAGSGTAQIPAGAGLGGARPHRPAHLNDPSGGAPLSGLTPRPPVKLAASPKHTTSPGSGATPTLSPTPAGVSLPRAWTGTVSTDPALAGALNNLSGLLANGNQPPAFLIPVYMEAGHRYHVPWEILAAINAIESDYGRNLSTSSAGAIGWMQFMPATWREYGVAVDGHSVANPFDPRDAIFSAARYLAANGAATNISGAIFAYNHATWYVQQVLARATAIASGVRLERAAVNQHGIVSVRIASAAFKHGVADFRGGFLWHYDRLIAAANMVSAANFPYLYGGGHEQPALFGPFDCSGAVSYVMQQAGYEVPTTVSGDVPSWGFPAGPGRVTIFYNPTHTFMRIGNRYFGTSGFARPGGGAGWFSTDKLPASYLAQFSEVHVPHLGTNSFAPMTIAAGSNSAAGS